MIVKLGAFNLNVQGGYAKLGSSGVAPRIAEPETIQLYKEDVKDLIHIVEVLKSYWEEFGER